MMINDSRYFAIVAGSLEKHAVEELTEHGASIYSQVPRGLGFTCSQRNLYRILYCSRLVQRILIPLRSYPCHSIKYLYQQARKNIAWTSLFSPSQSFGIDTNVFSSFTRHSLYAGQVLKDAICDSFREEFGERPAFTNKNPDILFNLHIQENRATISLDVWGESMHKRGYRKLSTEAPLQETLAAALVRLSGWQGERPLLDPMCGSGTILAEALMHWSRIPAAWLRDSSRLRLMPGFDVNLWEEVKTGADGRIRKLEKGLITGSDHNPECIKACRQNLSALPGWENVSLTSSSFQSLPPSSGLTIITNPPYGVRLGNSDQIPRLYNELGDFLKRKCPASESYILCGDKNLVKELRLRAHWTKSLKNGDLETKLAKVIVR
ncbi:MAG: THUMP domain-containing protein [Candidatus Cloacimonetes bacterium]|nr:THUMP domain-containing protein [Candidatus Cloacimonadota bacterium]